MEQRTYSRLFGTVRGSGSQANEEMQKSPLPGPATGHSNLPTLINAPTSLTNLAQLSGISLVPTSERRTTLNLSSNNSQIISYNGHQQPKITVNPRSRQNQPANIQRAPAVTNNHIGEQQTYNLNTIPSIQLLNRVTTDHQRASRVGNVPTLTVDPKPKKAATTSHSNPQHRLDNSNSYHRRFQNVVIPGSQSTNRRENSVSANQINIPCASEEQPFNNDFVQATGETSTNSVNDNISLLRLMAIFNNPALTITPIGPASTTPQHHIDSNSRASISAVFPNKTSYQLQHEDLDPYTLSGNRSQNTDSLDKFDIYGNQSTKDEEVRYSFADRKAPIAVKSSDYRVIDHYDRHADRNSLPDGSHTVTLSWSPNNIINNDFSDLEPKADSSAPIDPARILKEFVVASEANHSSHLGESGQTEQECMDISRKVDLKPLEKPAKSKITSHRVFSKHDNQKPTKDSIISTKRRLYVPRKDKTSTKKVKLAPCFNEIEVDTIERDSYVSEHHRILTKIDEIAESSGLKRNMAVRPRDVSVNSTNKFMSTIDTIMTEYEEKIETSQLEEDEADSIKCEFSFQRPLINEVLVLPIQLPLDEKLTEEKREYMSLFGIVSRDERNKIIARQSEERLNLFSSLNELGDFSDVDGDVRRIVNTLIQTGGDNISLRTETDIKRNELPFIEGLTRNTSRIKMNFMNALGLEKRSKRTTLYKVVKPQEVITANSMELKAHNDLNNTVKKINFSHVAETKFPLVNASSKLVPPIAKMNQVERVNQVNGNGMSSIKACGGSAEILRRAIKLAQASCREALHKVPNKDEYMKSLGLMAS